MKVLQLNAAFLGTLILMIGLFLSSCSNSAKKGIKSDPINIDTLSSDYLFNGRNLDGWEITSFGTEGPVMVSEGTIVLGMGDGLTGITWKGDFPKINYEVSLEAKKVSGNDFFCGLTFPVDTTYCSLILGGWGGPVVGLSTIDGYDASENETRTLMNFEHDKWYKIRLQVKRENIMAWVDDEKLVDYNIEGHELYIRPEVTLSIPFGIAAWTTTAALRNIKMNKLEN